MEEHINYKEKLDALIEQHNLIMDNIEDIVYQLNTLGFVEYVNSASKRFGYEPKQLIGKHMKDVIPVSEVPKALQALQRLCLGQAIETFEIKIKDANGKTIDGEINIVPLKKNGKVIGVQGIIRDITESKNADRELAKQIMKLEKANKSMAGREIRIIELKKEINKLLNDLGRAPLYDF